MNGRAKALILAAGVGSRLRPLTDRLPKCLVPVRGRPIVDLWLQKLLWAGVYDVLINTHSHAELVRSYLAQVNGTGLVDVRETYEQELLGSAGTIAANGGFADGADEVVVIYPDNVSQVDLRAMLGFHRSHGQPMTMLLFRAPNPRACGIAELSAEGVITGFVEKPAEPRSNLANAGVYVVSAEAYREIAAMRARDIGFEVLPRFVGRMAGYEIAGFHRDIGTPSDLAEVEREAVWIDAPAPVRLPGRKPAVFLDRDGTIVEQVHYLHDPGHVRVLPGAAAAIAGLQGAGYACVCVSNQAGIGKGHYDEAAYQATQAEMHAQLGREGVRLDGSYFCPVKPEAADRRTVDHPDRKPGPGMLLRAAGELGLDLARSWMVGDLASDALAGINAGCEGVILLRGGLGPSSVSIPRAAGVHLADGLGAAAALILGRGPGGAGMKGIGSP